VIVYNRDDCCKDRIVGASVFIKKEEEYVKDCGKINSAENSYTFNCEGDGNVMEISQEGKVGKWNIAEIEVYGTPAKIPSPGLNRCLIFFRVGVRALFYPDYLFSRRFT